MEREDHPHPRREPRFPRPLSREAVEQVFDGCADFSVRRLRLGGTGREVTACWLDGMAKTERLNDYIFRPLLRDKTLAGAAEEELPALLTRGTLYARQVRAERELDPVVFAIVEGSCALFIEGIGELALVVPADTEEKRSVGEPENEPALKGARDSFVEGVRTNTSLVRRRLRAPELKVAQHIVGRQTLTPVDVLWLEGIADPDTVERVRRRLDRIDIDGVAAAGDLEEYVADRVDTPFPLMSYTQRPDRFCRGLLEGRVGLLCDGLAIGYLLPATADQFFKTGQDRAYHWLTVSVLSCVRYLCAAITLLLPGLYIALVTRHPEAIPVKLALSIAAAKGEVPFSTTFEVLIMLLSFEILQEAGLRLPAPVGSTVSILGGLVVGSAAVDARIVSPAVLMAVAIAGVAGYTMPSQEFSAALRLWRFLLAVLAGLGGLFGLWLGCVLLLNHLAGLKSFGVPYLAPFTAGRGRGGPTVLRPPLKQMKWRSAAPPGKNRRAQR